MCDSFGNNIAALQVSFVTLEEMRLSWINKKDVISLQFIELLLKLTQIYPLFQSVVSNAIFTVTNPVFLGVMTSVTGMRPLGGEETATYLMQSARQNLFLTYSMFQAIPASNCYQVAYKSAVPIRFLFGIVADPSYLEWTDQ